MTTADGEWLSAEEAGLWLGAGRRLIYELVDRGELPARRWPVSVRKADLLAYIERCRVQPGTLTRSHGYVAKRTPRPPD